jgi:chromosome segregation ATPase
MNRASKALIVAVVAMLGIWGCAQGPGGSHVAQAERLRALEGKCGKLEEDYRAVAGARDQFRKRAAALEEERGKLQQELAVLNGVVQERDELRRQVASRTGERDALQARCDRLKKGLQNLLGQDEAAAPPPAQPVTSAADATPGGKS